jgi:hypothetical protein
MPIRGGDATSVLTRVPKLLVNTAHFTNKSQNCQIQIEARRANGAAFLTYREQRQERANQSQKPCECRYQACLFKGGHDASPYPLRTWGKLKMANLYRRVRGLTFPQKCFGDGASGRYRHARARLA